MMYITAVAYGLVWSGIVLGDDGKPSDDTIVNEVESHHKLLFAGGLLVCIFWVGNTYNTTCFSCSQYCT